MNYELDDLDLKYDSPSKVEKGQEEVEEGLWEKLERVGKKISFAKDIKALYRYMRDKYVPWYRKSIVIGALIYFISPIDAVPDLAPLIGYLDDLGVVTAVLKFMGSELIPYYE
ncbi:MAG TPA: YkvA family protein [Melioribacteraceae bacterium]|nr:YkvA family protein [Melioribacteraceae bacterium]